MTTGRALLVAALALTGFSMRTAVTSVGAALSDIESGLNVGSGAAGVITTLPVICFAVLGASAPRLSTRFAPHRTLVVALAVCALGLVLRAVSSSIWLFGVFSVLALTGGAIANVMLPSLVKLHFPDRVGTMTAVYTTALATGATIAAGLTVPLGDLGGSWRFGIGSWALFAVVAVLPWLPSVRHEHGPANVDRGTVIGTRTLLRNPTAWALTAFFGAQSMSAYIGFGWLARFMSEHGVRDSTAGWMVALMSAVGIPISMVVPVVAPRRHALMVLALGLASALAYVGLGVAPVGGAWLWMALYGIGGGMFPLALTMIGIRSRRPENVAALSAFVQSIGYVIAGTGPLLFGVLFGATGGWTLPLAVLWVSLTVSIAGGWFAARPRFVDDDAQETVIASSRSRRNWADTTGG